MENYIKNFVEFLHRQKLQEGRTYWLYTDGDVMKLGHLSNLAYSAEERNSTTEEHWSNPYIGPEVTLLYKLAENRLTQLKKWNGSGEFIVFKIVFLLFYRVFVPSYQLRTNICSWRCVLWTPFKNFLSPSRSQMIKIPLIARKAVHSKFISLVLLFLFFSNASLPQQLKNKAFSPRRIALTMWRRRRCVCSAAASSAWCPKRTYFSLCTPCTCTSAWRR